MAITSSSKNQPSAPSELTWSPDTEIIGLVFELSPCGPDYLYAQYTIGLHAWFLAQVRSSDPELSAYLHDSQSEKPFTISSLEGDLLSSGKDFQLQPNCIYRWYVTAFSLRLVQWLTQWVKNLPSQIDLRNAPLLIRSCQIALRPITYNHLFTAQLPQRISVQLSFQTPTSFRRKKHHFPLPVPNNVFHSYLRRWNDFSGIPFDQEKFLTWVEEEVLISRYRLESVKVAAGKVGMVTGFTGAIELNLTRAAFKQVEFVQLFYALVNFAPYCGTGHKTTFGLGQTRLGWLNEEPVSTSSNLQDILATRIAYLTEMFIAQRKRTGGNRASEIAEIWATITARRELGESLQAIAIDLEIPYETVKTYAKLARRSLKTNSTVPVAQLEFGVNNLAN